VGVLRANESRLFRPENVTSLPMAAATVTLTLDDLVTAYALGGSGGRKVQEIPGKNSHTYYTIPAMRDSTPPSLCHIYQDI
jgi:hypothetical protein